MGDDRQMNRVMVQVWWWQLGRRLAALLELSLIHIFVSARYSQEKNPKRTSKTALLNEMCLSDRSWGSSMTGSTAGGLRRMR